MGLEDKCYELLLNYTCNARCRFCSQENDLKTKKFLNIGLEEIIRKIFEAKKNGYTKLGLTGGEPLLRKDIIQIVKIAKKAGFKYIRIQTNGILLSDYVLAEKLMMAGVNFFKISIHSHIEDVNDYLMGVKFAYKSILRAIKNINKLKVRLSLSIVINKKNYKDLEKYVKFFLKRDVSEFIFVFPVYIANMEKNKKELFVSYQDVVPFLRKAYRNLEINGIKDYLFFNIPPCFLPERVDKIIGISLFNSTLYSPMGEYDLDTNSDEDSVKLTACKKCIYENRCRGVNTFYISIIKNVDLVPVIKEKKTKNIIKKKKHFYTSSEKCFLEILRKENKINTKRVLEVAKTIPLCMDCDSSINAINAGESLVDKGVVKKIFVNDDYIWVVNI